jgi:DNA-binding LacI/PurR family transcriptional regulator
MVPDICNPFYTELVQAIQTEVATVGLDVVIFNTDVPGGQATIHSNQYFRQITPKRYDGVIVAGEALVGNEDVLRDLKVPAVYVGHLREPVIDYVTIDEYGAGYMATQYLVQKGHRLIAHISGEPAFFAGQKRRQGYEAALRDAGISICDNLIYPGTFLGASGRDGMRALLAQDPPPTAVFVANSLMAIGAVAAAHDLAIRIPQDIALTTMDNISAMDDVRPTLTTVDFDPRMVGHMAAQRLIEKLERDEGNELPRRIDVPYTLIERDSA